MTVTSECLLLNWSAPCRDGDGVRSRSFVRKCTGIAVNVSETAHTRHESHVGGTGSCLGSQEKLYSCVNHELFSYGTPRAFYTWFGMN